MFEYCLGHEYVSSVSSLGTGVGTLSVTRAYLWRLSVLFCMSVKGLLEHTVYQGISINESGHEDLKLSGRSN